MWSGSCWPMLVAAVGVIWLIRRDQKKSAMSDDLQAIVGDYGMLPPEQMPVAPYSYVPVKWEGDGVTSFSNVRAPNASVIPEGIVFDSVGDLWGNSLKAGIPTGRGL